jgi:AraC-like DNA-binding protein
MHVVLGLDGDLRARAAGSRWLEGAGVVTGPDVAHEIDSRGTEVLLVFLDPESLTGATLRGVIDGVRMITPAERAALVKDADPERIMQADGEAWTRRASEVLGGAALPLRRPLHPRVRRLLRLMREEAVADTSLEALAEAVDLSPSRLMHVFTESVGVPIRPYLAWLKVQRAAAAIALGEPLAHAAHAAGFADSGHMTRTFKRMFGMPPSALRAATAAPSPI